MGRFFFCLAAILLSQTASAECFGGRCAVGVARVVTAPVRVVAPVARAAVVAPVRIVENVVVPAARVVVAAPVRVVEHAVPVVGAVVTAPVRVIERIADNSAQRYAERLAATGSFCHCPDRGGAPYEGLGFSTVSPDDACRRACYWGRRPVREIGTAWCPHRHGYVAVVRYN